MLFCSAFAYSDVAFPPPIVAKAWQIVAKREGRVEKVGFFRVKSRTYYMKKSDFFEVQIRIYSQYIKTFNDMIQLIPFKRMVNVNGETKQMYALRLNPIQPVEFDVLARLIAQRTTLTEYEVEFVLSELQTVMIENLELGRGVRFGRLGTFEPSLKAEAVEKENDLNLSTVKKVNIIYKPSLEIKKALKNFRFRIIR